MDLPLPENSLGNFYQNAAAEHLNKLQGIDGFAKGIEPLKMLREVDSRGGEVFIYSSWTKFPVYEIDFGWGKPIRACTLPAPVRNCVVMMTTKSGDGIEAWITLTENGVAKFEINEELLQETVKPSSFSDHAKDFKLCLLDELAPPSYVPVLLFYPPPPPPADAVSDKLKKSLSETLARFHPLAGKLKGNISFDCNEEGVLFIEAKVNISASEIINNPQAEMLRQLFPLDPSQLTEDESEAMITGVQVNIFYCGSVGIGVCVSHKIVDASSLSYFLQAWAATMTGIDRTLAPHLDSALLFPATGFNFLKPSDIIGSEKIVTKRFLIDSKNLANLKSKIRNKNMNATCVEAVTALVWKSAMEDKLRSTIATHAVNIRKKMEPPLPENSLGNFYQSAVAEYLNKLQGVDGLAKGIEPLKMIIEVGSGGGEVFLFSSWTRFPVYEIEFRWGKPIQACTLPVPIKNCVVLMATKSGDGIEAWINLTENGMAKFESNKELLQFVSAST